jgi:hypothetical protein
MGISRYLARKEEIGEAPPALAVGRSRAYRRLEPCHGPADQYFATVLDNLLPAFGF